MRAGLVIVGLWIVFVIGWILNLYKLVDYSGTLANMGMLEIMRIVGIFVAPLGGFLGYF